MITGANKGIGWEMVRLLAEQQPSATILLGSRSQANGDAAVQKLPEAARKQVKVLVIDVTDDESVKAAADKVKAEYGQKVTASAAMHAARERRTSRPCTYDQSSEHSGTCNHF